MSQWLGQTNRKLYQCRLLLDLWQQADQVPLQQALQESALYQLRDAWLTYLHELADTVRLRQSIDSLAQLLEQTPLAAIGHGTGKPTLQSQFQPLIFGINDKHKGIWVSDQQMAINRDIAVSQLGHPRATFFFQIGKTARKIINTSLVQ